MMLSTCLSSFWASECGFLRLIGQAPAPSGGSLSITTFSDAEKSATLALVAPTVMWFDAVPSGLGADPVTLPPLDYATTPLTGTTNLMYDPAFNEVFYFWKLTTTPVGYRTTYHSTDYNMPTAWNDRRIAYGQKVAFCFDEPGSYTLECFAVGPTGTTATQTTSFTIADPDTAYSGSATLCVNPAGDSDFSWAPSGSTNYNTGADDRAVVVDALDDYRVGTTNRRILFKPGATFDMRGAEIGFWNNTSDTRLRHYVGSPLGESPAIFDLGPSANGPRFQDDGDHASVTISNMEFVGPFDPAALVPKSGDGFLEGIAGLDANPPWKLHDANSLNTHFNFFRIKMRDFRGQYFQTPYQQRTDRGVGPRTGFAECDADFSNFGTSYFQNSSRRLDGTVIPLSAPRPKVAFIGTKIVAPANAKEFNLAGYVVTSSFWPMRFSYIGEVYFGAFDFHTKTNTIDPLVRAHAGSFHTDNTRAGWQYINIDRFVGEGVGPQGMIGVGTQEDAGSNPLNIVMDKFLYIGTQIAGHRVISGGHALGAGTYRNGVAVIPATTVGNTAISSGWASDHEADDTYDLQHPRRIHNLTYVSLGDNTIFFSSADFKPLMQSQAISELPALTLSNNVIHYANQTRSSSTDWKQTNLTGSTIAGVTPRYPGRNDVQDMFQPASLTGASIANGATFDVTFTEINAVTTRSLGRSYTALVTNDTYWTSNPTHNFHYIRQGGTYHYVYNSGLSVSVLSDRLRFTNNTGGTLSGNWEIWIDRRGLHPGPQASSANPSDMPLSWTAGAGSSVIPAPDALEAFDEFGLKVRAGNTVPTGSGLTLGTIDAAGAFA